MKRILLSLLLLSASSYSLAQKNCDELKTEIAAKLDAKGVVMYTLEIVPNEDVHDQKVVGSCDGGTRKITYRRGE